MNVRLRLLLSSDAAWADAWLAGVAASVGHDVSGVTSLIGRQKKNRGVISRSIKRDDEQVGVLIAEIGRPDRHAAIIELVALAPGHARRGSGMRAAAMIETELRELGVSRVYAPAPAAHGIAVYFWIRLGYHPLLQPEWPCARDGVAWMMRELTA